MNSDTTPARTSGRETKDIERKRTDSPDWANGLRRLYDSVVDEPLPDSFKDLLSKLDDNS